MSSDSADNDPISQLSSTPIDACSHCKKTISAKCLSTTVRCVRCNEACHAACIVSSFVAINGMALKNSLQWLVDFLRAGNFQFVCPKCNDVNNSTGGVSAREFPAQGIPQLRNDMVKLQTSFSTLSDSIGLLAKQLNELKTSIQPFPVSELESPQGSGKTATPVSLVQPPSYASVVSKSIAESVKRAVSETIKDRDNIARDKSSVVIFGLSENHHDLQDITGVLKTIFITLMPVACFRLGRVVQDNAAYSRPLKVVFSSVADRDSVLRSASGLRKHDVYAKVRIAKYLSSEEMTKLKQTRDECKKLNDTSGIQEPGKKQYVVINGKIMKKDADGKLKLHQRSNAADNASSQSKNG